MKKVETKAPSFPAAPANEPLGPPDPVTWRVVCGDSDHWRAGFYSPAGTSRSEVRELERHDCPELFLLLGGEITLILMDKDGLRELPLELEKPVLVTAPHSAYCPGGPHAGVCLVVERDAFQTEYRTLEEWRRES